MEQVPFSVKSKKDLTQTLKKSPEKTNQIQRPEIAELWLKEHSPQKAEAGTLTQSRDNPEASLVTPAFDVMKDRSVRTLGNTKRFSKTSPVKKPVKSAGKLTERIKKAQQLSGLQFTKRVKHCGKCQYDKPETELLQHGQGIVRKRGIQMCGNVWECSVCRPYLQWKLREEIRKVHEYSTQLGDDSFMASITMPHKRKDDFETNLAVLQNAWNNFRNDRQYLALMSRLGQRWSIRTLEVTYGDRNGYHPHFHILFSVREKVSELIQQIQSELTAIWTRVLGVIRNREGITTSTILTRWIAKNSVKITPVNELAADYFVKHSWGTGAEITDGGFTGKKAKGSNWSLGELEIEMTNQWETKGELEPWLRGVLTQFYKSMKRKKFVTKQGEYHEIIKEIEENETPKQTDENEDEEHSNITGRVTVKKWLWDEVFHKYGINYDLIGEVKCRRPGEEFLEIRDFLIYELWKVMKPVPVSEIEYLIDSNVFIETEENKTGLDAGFSVREKRKENSEPEDKKEYTGRLLAS